MEPYALSAFVTLCASVMSLFLAFKVGMMRQKHGVNPWEATNIKEVLITNRVHLNTVENMAVFLPIFWVATVFGGFPMVAGWIGVIWLILRGIYAYMYTSGKKRFPWFPLSQLCVIVLFLLSLYGIVVI